MTATITEEKPAKVTKPKKVDPLVDILGKVVETLSRIEEKLDTRPTVATPATPLPAPVPTQAPLSGVPVPLEFVETVNTVLNRKFGIDIKYMADSASFEFSVLVPQIYSNASKSHWDTYHEDRRSRVIENALGVNGVRDWCAKVYDNFNPEIKAAITAGRAEL